MRIGEEFIEDIDLYCDRWCFTCPVIQHCKRGFDSISAEEGGVQLEGREQFAEHVSGYRSIEDMRAFVQEALCGIGEILGDAKLSPDPEHWGAQLSYSAIASYMDLIMHDEDEPSIMRAIDESLESDWGEGHDGLVKAEFVMEYLRLAISGLRIVHCVRTASQAIQPDGTVKLSGPQKNCPLNGAARTAISLIDRSLVAAMMIAARMPDHEAELLEYHRRMLTLRGRLEHLFPKAFRFKRPGFDYAPR